MSTKGSQYQGDILNCLVLSDQRSEPKGFPFTMMCNRENQHSMITETWKLSNDGYFCWKMSYAINQFKSDTAPKQAGQLYKFRTTESPKYIPTQTQFLPVSFVSCVHCDSLELLFCPSGLLQGHEWFCQTGSD